MTVYYADVDNPKLYNQNGKIHASSPLYIVKGTPVNVTGAEKVANGLTILPLGNGTWVNAADVNTGTTPPASSNEYILHVRDGVTRKFIPV